MLIGCHMSASCTIVPDTEYKIPFNHHITVMVRKMPANKVGDRPYRVLALRDFNVRSLTRVGMEKMMKYTTTLASAVFGAFVLGSSTVSAAPLSLEVCSGATCWNGNYTFAEGVPVWWNDVQSDLGIDVSEVGGGLLMESWQLGVDSDPFVTNNFTITNTSGSTQTYTMTAVIGVSPAIASPLMRGSVGLTLTDNNDDGATLTDASGVSIYKALIDGNSARTLWDAPISFSTFSTTSANTDFGFPTREVAPESVDSTIGISMMFTLTAGDSASFTSNFNVIPSAVPVPAAVWLFGSGLLGLGAAARRRRR